jgi:hypothetical protein
MENHHDIVEERLGEIAINLGTKVNAWGHAAAQNAGDRAGCEARSPPPAGFQTIV